MNIQTNSIAYPQISDASFSIRDGIMDILVLSVEFWKDEASWEDFAGHKAIAKTIILPQRYEVGHRAIETGGIFDLDDGYGIGGAFKRRLFTAPSDTDTVTGWCRPRTCPY